MQDIRSEETTYREGVKESLEEIKSLVRYTNGRVRWLEKMVWMCFGFCTCITILILPFIWSLITAGKLL